MIEHETPANGNIFEDLGFPPDEAAHLLLQVELAFLIKDRVKKKRLTQARAAKLFGVSQQRINDLLRGKLDRFSIDMLIMMLARAGIKVGLTIEPMAAGGEPALRG